METVRIGWDYVHGQTNEDEPNKIDINIVHCCIALIICCKSIVLASRYMLSSQDGKGIII